jgi:hypothetical protein
LFLTSFRSFTRILMFRRIFTHGMVSISYIFLLSRC